MYCFFFFFQAEDGIRDVAVTGVQTCALPICFTKDNIMKLTDGLFHKVFDEIAAQYSEIENEHWIVDIGAAKLADTPDRKSTRLNSSHGYISYAVFCLKKKKSPDTISRSSL